MDTASLITFNLVLLAALISPGPAFLYAVQTTLKSGRSAGIATALGLATMASSWTAMAMLGLGGIFALFPWAYWVLKSAGALFLIYIAWTSWRNAAKPLDNSEAPSAHRSNAFWGGVLINLANPKSVLFASAVLVVVFPNELGSAQKLAVIANHWVVEVIVYSVFAVLFSTQAISQRYLRAKTVLDRMCAVIIGGLGLRLLFARSE